MVIGPELYPGPVPGGACARKSSRERLGLFFFLPRTPDGAQTRPLGRAPFHAASIRESGTAGWSRGASAGVRVGRTRRPGWPGGPTHIGCGLDGL